MAQRKDPMAEFFTLTFQSIKMNSEGAIPASDKTNCDELYQSAVKSEIPFFGWHKLITDTFREKYPGFGGTN
ncbi:MAG: hypothetical protein V2I33_24295 [Kangiellaceae bacterium]|jgi:hypothetical protein|nr:hypothetical protein [Kangiellaceae bacterium]